MKAMRGWLGLLVVAWASSCASLPGGKAPLRVGLTPNYPPLIMLTEGRAAGVECDFAVELAKELGRPLELVSVPLEMLFEDLSAGHVDILMSGLTVTLPRQARAAFCEPYMSNPLVAVVRRGEAEKYPDADSVLGATAGIGVLGKSSADTFARRRCGAARILPLTTREDVGFYLANQRIELYIDDLSAAVDIISRNEARLELVRFPLEEQELAWAVQGGDQALKQQVNEILARWGADGTRDRILDRWMPYRRMLPDNMK